MTETERGVDFAFVRDCALALPGVAEGTSYGTPALRVGRKFFVRLREDGATMVLRTDFHERDHLLAADPAAFFTEAHYDGDPAILIRLAAVRPEQLRGLIVEGWKRLARARQVAAYEASKV